MRYLIDGYNLAFRLYSDRHTLQQRREVTLADISEKIALLDVEATIIFDAQHTPEESSIGHFLGLKVCYTNYNETADEWILNYITEEKIPSKLTVVTSDRELASRARLHGAHSIAVDTFFNWLKKRFKNAIFKEKKPLKQPKPQISLPKPKPKEKKPAFATPAEECLEYYLEAFSKNIPVNEPLPQKITKLKQKQHAEAVPSGKKTDENLLEYYKKIFEELLDG